MTPSRPGLQINFDRLIFLQFCAFSPHVSTHTYNRRRRRIVCQERCI